MIGSLIFYGIISLFLIIVFSFTRDKYPGEKYIFPDVDSILNFFWRAVSVILALSASLVFEIFFN
jgi:hypothetical protein